MLQAIGKISSDPIYAKDVEGRFLYANPAVLEVIGKSADEVLGHTDLEFHSDPEQAAIVMANDQHIMGAGITEVIEETWEVRGGGVRTYRSRKAPLYLDDGSLTGIVCMSTDITKLKGIEAQLRQAKVENKFYLLAEALPQIVWITRADGWNVYFNQKWVEYTGLTLDESHGHGWNKPFHPEDKQRAWDAWQNAVNNNGAYSLECRLRRADGEYRWWLVRGVPLTDENGKIEKWFGTCTDIHDLIVRKQVEIELRAAKVEADRRSLAKSKFIAAASHDLRQPVQSLTLLLSLIEQQVADRPQAAKVVHMAHASVASLTRLLNGILDISRLDAGEVTPTMASEDLGELVDQFAREYAPRAAGDGLELRHAPRALRARTDVVLLERILRNLIENALRYTVKGGVLIGVRQRGEWVRLDVIDTGIGIAGTPDGNLRRIPTARQSGARRQ